MQNPVSKRRAVLKVLGGNSADNAVKILADTLPVLVADVFLMLSKYHQDLSNLKSLLRMELTEQHRFIFASLPESTRSIWNIKEIASHRGPVNLEHFLSYGPRNMERLRISRDISAVVYKHEQAVLMAAQDQQREMVVSFYISEQGSVSQRAIRGDLSLLCQANKKVMQAGRELITSVGLIAQEAMLTSVIRRDILSCNVTNSTLCKYVPIISKAVTISLPSKFVVPEIMHILHFGLPGGFFEILHFASKVVLSYTLDLVALDYQIDNFVMGTISYLYAYSVEYDDNQGRSISEVLDNTFTDNNDILAFVSLSHTTSYLIASYVGFSFTHVLLLSGAVSLTTDYVLTSYQKGTLATLPSSVGDIYDLLPEKHDFIFGAVEVFPCP